MLFRSFNFHGYPYLIHRLSYRRHNHHNLHVRGYKERGSINTPLELAIQNEIDRFSLVIDVIKYVGNLGEEGEALKSQMLLQQEVCRQYAYEHGVDAIEVDEWTWSA